MRLKVQWIVLGGLCMRLRVLAFWAVLTLSVPAAITSAATFAGGTGEPNDPYQIATAEQLLAIGSNTNLLDKCFVLTADIDLDPTLPGGKVLDRPVIAPDDIENPFSDTPAFTGCLDGKGHAIRHLRIQVPRAVRLGLFGLVGPGGRIRALDLDDVQIRGEEWSGSLAGKIDGGSVDTCRSSGRVSGDYGYVGGLVAESINTTYVACQSSCSLYANRWSVDCMGGLIGRNCGGTISNSSASGEVWYEGANYAGGLVGLNEGGNIYCCFSTGAILTEDDGGSSAVGGLAGRHTGGRILGCYATGALPSAGCAGGLVGDSSLGSIQQSYATGAVTLSEHAYYYEMGGLVGHNNGTRVHGFWNTITSGLRTSAGGLGLETAEMTAPLIYSLNGWGGDPNWVMTAGDYPHLAWEGKQGQLIPSPTMDWLDGQGTAGAPYRITQPTQLARLATASILWDKHFVLVNDLDLKDVVFRPIGAMQGMEFQGRFQGAGHVLNRLSVGTFDRACYDAALFSCVGSHGQVEDLGLRNVQVLAGKDSEMLATLASLNQGVIARCFAAGSIRLTGPGTYVGGLVGINDGRIVDCHASVVLDTLEWNVKDYAGGLVGFNRAGFVSRCYAAGFIMASRDDRRVGGLAGSNTGKVCWSLWDTWATACSTSDGGLGFDPLQMREAQTYARNGWAQEPNWVIRNGVDYPRLAWEDTAGTRIPQMNVEGLQGRGTADDPYRVSSVSQLAMIGQASSLWDKCLTLETDLDLTGAVLRPIGTSGMGFCGSFDGRGHALRSLRLGNISTCQLYQGLFGVIEKEGTIRNLAIEDGRVAGGPNSSKLGLLAGVSAGDIDTCRVDGIVTAEDCSSDIGGMVGLNAGVLLNCNVQASVASMRATSNVGGLVGANSGVIHVCVADAVVVAVSRSEYGPDDTGGCVGGLVGQNAGGVLSNCRSLGSTTGYYRVGGICGSNAGTVFHCEALGTVTCDPDSGGIGMLAGDNVSGLITVSSATGSITGGGSSPRAYSEDISGMGGLVGWNQGIIERSSAAVDVFVFDGYAGGLLGTNSDGMVIDCYSGSSTLVGSGTKGGLVGAQSGILLNVYASPAAQDRASNAYTGGLIGCDKFTTSYQSIIKAAYFLSPNDGGGPDNGYGTPLSAGQMRNMESFAGWDFFGRSADGNGDVWFMPQNRPPLLSWQAPQTGLAVVPNIAGLTLEQVKGVLEGAGFRVGSVRTDSHRSTPVDRGIRTQPLSVAPAGSIVDLILSTGPYSLKDNPGDGTAAHPYQVATAGQLEALTDHPEEWSKCFVLTDDLDMSGRLFDNSPIAPYGGGFPVTSFTGRFDGAGHTIHHLDVIAPNRGYLGLFGSIGKGAQVRNLRLNQVRIAGGSSSFYVGSIAGYMEGTLVGCYAQGLVCGGDPRGELVGLNNEGTLSDCSSDVLVQATPVFESRR
jgi:hypothetical protein